MSGVTATAALVHQYIGVAESLRLRMRVWASRTVDDRGIHRSTWNTTPRSRSHSHSRSIGLAVRSFDAGRMKRVHRRRRVAPRADVPLDPAREPGVAQGQVGRLHDRVDVQQLPVRSPVVERQQPPAEVEGDGGAQRVVLQHGDAMRSWFEPAAVVVLGEVRQQRRRRPLAGAGGDVGGDVACDVLDLRRADRASAAGCTGRAAPSATRSS